MNFELNSNDSIDIGAQISDRIKVIQTLFGSEYNGSIHTASVDRLYSESFLNSFQQEYFKTDKFTGSIIVNELFDPTINPEHDTGPKTIVTVTGVVVDQSGQNNLLRWMTGDQTPMQDRLVITAFDSIINDMNSRISQ